MVAALAPTAVGLNATCIVHDAPAPSVAPHVVALTAKSALLITGAEIAPVVVPLFASVSVSEALALPTRVSGNDKDAGANALTKLPAPVPLNAAEIVPLSLVICNDPLRAPVAVGLKTTSNAHDAPAASELPHVFALTAKSPANTGAPNAPAPAPLLLIVNAIAPDVLPTTTEPNTSEPGDTAAVNVPAPLPLS